MAQSDLYEFLKENKGKMFTTYELGQVIGSNRQCMSRCANKLSNINKNVIVIPANHAVGRKGMLVKFDDTEGSQWEKIERSLIDLGESESIMSTSAKN